MCVHVYVKKRRQRVNHKFVQRHKVPSSVPTNWNRIFNCNSHIWSSFACSSCCTEVIFRVFTFSYVFTEKHIFLKYTALNVCAENDIFMPSYILIIVHRAFKSLDNIIDYSKKYSTLVLYFYFRHYLFKYTNKIKINIKMIHYEL